MFRIVFAAAMIVLSLNLSVVFALEKANPFEKGIIFAAAIVFAIRGRLEKSYLLGFFLIIGATFVSAFGSHYADFSWDIFSRAEITLVTLALFMCTIPREDDRDVILKVVAWTPLLQVILGLVYFALLGRPFMSGEEGGLRLNGSSIPAFLGAVSAAGFCAAMALASLRNPRYLALCLLNVAILLLSGGRMAFAVGILGGAGILLFGFRQDPRLRMGIISVSAVVMLVVGPILGGTMLERAASGALSGREYMWQYLMEIFQEHMYFGFGYGHQYTLVSREITVMTGTVAAHNDYLRLMVELGYVGGSIIAAGFIALLVAGVYSPFTKSRKIFVTLFLAFLLFASTDNALGRLEESLILIMACLASRVTLDEIEAKPPPLIA